MRYRAFLSAFGVSLICGTATGAYAQVTVQPPASADSNPSASSVTSQPTDDSQLQEIVVTAQKRAQSLQDVPISISVVQADAIQERGIKLD